MKFYSFANIAAVADCRDIAATLYGCKIVNGRTSAPWRGGTNPESVTISKDQWYDHGSGKQGGGAVQLASFHFNNDAQAAQQWLGEHYHLTPKMETGAAPSSRKSRYDELIEAGYQEITRYDYRNLAGELIHFVIRLQHPEKPGKQFVQGTPDGWGLKGITTILYRLDVVSASSWVALCEGEKSADRLNAAGIPATTACMGAGKWHDGLSEALRGKDVAIFPDNDEPGREHAQTVARAIHGIATSVRVVQPADCLPTKGGIDDFLDLGHSPDEVLSMIASAPEWHPASASASSASMSSTTDEPTPAMLAEAKQANSIPFRNYIPNETESERRGKKVKDVIKEPRTHQAMLDDLWRRFLGFPRRVGSYTLFDHDRDTGEIIEMDKAHEFRAWIARRSKQNPEFTKGDAMANELDFMASIRTMTHSYESVSLVPDWPLRSEVYYAHDKIPPATPDHRYLNEFASFFLPAESVDAMLIKAFICAPLWYIPGVPRPAWIIDSRDGQGSGKSLLAFMVAELYGGAPLTVTRHDLEREQKEIRKRCVCAEGRNKRIFLVDNVTGLFRSPELASLITFKYISGLAPYGHGEESRPNNFVYVITSNTATVDSDLADRSLSIFVKRPEIGMRIGWVERVQNFIKKHRLNVMADIIDMLEKHSPFDIPTETRFSEFEQCIIQPCAGDPELMRELLDHIVETRKDINIEDEQARSIMETFNYQLRQLNLDDCPVFIQNRVANSWGGQALSDTLHTEISQRASETPVTTIRKLATQDKISQIDPAIKRWPTSSQKDRYRGLAWNFTESTDDVPMVYLTPDNRINTKII